MKQKTLFQKGMQGAMLSLILTAGALNLGSAHMVSAAEKVKLTVNAPNDGSLVLLTMDDLSDEMQEMLNGMELGGAVQELEEHEMALPVIYKVSSFVQPDADAFGTGGYYLPDNYAADLSYENIEIVVCSGEEKIEGYPMVIISPSGELSEDVTINLPPASAQQNGSLENLIKFSKGQASSGNYLKIDRDDDSLTDMVEWKHIPVEGDTSKTGGAWSSWNPTSALVTLVTNGTIQMRYKSTSDQHPVKSIYEFEVVNGEKKESKEKFTVTIQNTETSHLQKASGSGELTQQVEVDTAIQPIIIEPTSYKTPGSESSEAAGYYIEKDCLGDLQTYGLSAAYEDNKITITGTPTQNVTITLPTAPAQSAESRDVSDQLCYIGDGVYAGTTEEMVYYSLQTNKWSNCDAGKTTVGKTGIKIKYKETAAYPTSTEFAVLVDEVNYQKKIEIESVHGKVALTYHGIATNYMEISSGSGNYKHTKLQQPQAEVTADTGYRCIGLELYNNNNSKVQNITLTDGKGTLTYSGGGNGTGNYKLVAVYEPIFYSIQAASAEHGSITVPTSAGYETEVTIIAEPDPGYMLADISVKTENGKDVPVQDNKFTMPLGNVTITPVFKLTAEKENELAANAVAALINSIGNVTYTDASKALIDAARAAYNELTADQKAFIPETTLTALTNAEAAYAALKSQMESAAANQAAANAVAEKINAIGNVAYSDVSKALIDAARAAYNALTDEQKTLVAADKLAALTNAEAAYASLKQQADALKSEEEKRAEEERQAAEAKKAADQAAANAAADKINAIGNVAYSDASKVLIDAAMAAYDALTADQKALIPADKLTVLTNAETTYTALTAAALAPKLEQKKAGQNSVSITWKEDKKATAGYRIYIKGGSYKKFTKVADTKKGVTSYTIKKANKKKLTASTQYEIKIVSLKKSGKKTVELSTQKLKAVTVTAAPKFTSAKRSKNGKQLTLKWKKVSGASGYELQMSTKAKTGFKKIATCKAKATSYTKKGLTKSKTYYFRMRTYKTVNGKKFYSSWSAVKKVSKVK